jgi:hypothetical protein
MAAKLLTAAGGGITLDAASTATDKTLTLPADNGTIVYANSSGNVGVGTTSPSFSGFGSNTNGVQVTNGNNAAYKLSGNAGGDFYFVSGSGQHWLYATGAVPMSFSTNGTERARIDSSGRLLVNTTSALGSSKLVVEADTTTANPMTVSNSRSSAATDYSIIFYRNASIVGSVQTSLSATSYVTSSDYRLKENIAPMTGALDKVAQLKPCTYNWKLDGEASQGFIAHELQAVVPECVTGEKDAVDADGNPKYQGIDTSFLVATLTAAIQELKAIVDAQAQRITALEGTQQ